LELLIAYMRPYGLQIDISTSPFPHFWQGNSRKCQDLAWEACSVQEKRIKRQQTVGSAGCKVLAPNPGFLLASMPSYCRFRPMAGSYLQSVSVSVHQDKLRGSAIHHSEPPAPGPQAAGRSGFPASARLLPAGLGAAGGGPPRIFREPGPGPGPGATRGRSGPLADATGCCVGSGPGPLRPPAVVRWGWLSGRSPRQRGARRGRAPAPPRWPRPPGAYPLPL